MEEAKNVDAANGKQTNGDSKNGHPRNSSAMDDDSGNGHARYRVAMDDSGNGYAMNGVAMDDDSRNGYALNGVAMDDDSRNGSAAAAVWYVREAENESDTEAFAAELALRADAGTMLALDGELGAGKTRFAQAFALALGIPGIVNSPTFTIIKEYDDGRLPFYHMDVYRLSLAEADELGLDEYFLGEGVSLVEWASLIEPILPPERLHIIMEHTGPTSRRLRCRPLGGKYEVWCRELGMALEEEHQT